jgi:hypothetical protein
VLEKNFIDYKFSVLCVDNINMCLIHIENLIGFIFDMNNKYNNSNIRNIIDINDTNNIRNIIDMMQGLMIYNKNKNKLEIMDLTNFSFSEFLMQYLFCFNDLNSKEQKENYTYLFNHTDKTINISFLQRFLKRGERFFL